MAVTLCVTVEGLACTVIVWSGAVTVMVLIAAFVVLLDDEETGEDLAVDVPLAACGTISICVVVAFGVEDGVEVEEGVDVVLGVRSKPET